MRLILAGGPFVFELFDHAAVVVVKAVVVQVSESVNVSRLVYLERNARLVASRVCLRIEHQLNVVQKAVARPWKKEDVEIYPKQVPVTGRFVTVPMLRAWLVQLRVHLAASIS